MPVGNGSDNDTTPSTSMQASPNMKSHTGRLSHESARSSFSVNYEQPNGSSFRSQSVTHLPHSIRKGYPWVNMRRDSNLSATSSLSLDSDGSISTKDYGFNAISGVLNNPSKRGKSSYKPTKSDIPAVPPANIRKVKTSEFLNYITQISPEYDKYKQNKARRKEDNANVSSPTPSSSENGTLSASAATLLKNNGSYDKNSQEWRRSSSGTSTPFMQSVLNDLPPLESIPSYFFDDDFNLGNPRVFDAVTEHNDVIGLAPDTRHRALATNAILQERLSQYIDTIEVHLIKEISKRSGSFFTALANLQSLHSDSAMALENLRKLRKEITEFDEKYAKKALDIIAAKRRRDMIAEVHAALKVIEEIKATEPIIKVLLNQGDYHSALDVIDEAWNLMNNHGTKSHGVDMGSIRALNSFKIRLDNMHQSAGTMLEQDLLTIMQTDLQEYTILSSDRDAEVKLITLGISSVRAGEKNAKILDNQENDKVALEIRDRILPLITGLRRTDRVAQVRTGYRDMALKEVRMIVKRRLPSDGNEDENKNRTTSEKSAALAKALRSMNFDAFYSMMSSVYIMLARCLIRMALQKGILEDLLMENNPTSNTPSANESIAQETDIDSNGNTVDDELESVNPESITKDKLGELDNDSIAQFPDLNESTEQEKDSKGKSSPADFAEIITAAVDLAHVRCSKILGVRADQNSKLNMKDFHRFFVLTFGFVVECEKLCGRTCYGLRGSLSGQAKSFLTHFHMEKMRQMSTLLENEQWKSGIVPVDFQQIADLIVKSATEDPIEFLENQPGTDGLGMMSPGIQQVMQKNGANGESKKYIAIEDHNFNIVTASLLAVKMIADYLKCLFNMPLYATEVMNRVVELLKVFNSRTCQVVLGAGAMRSAGLRNITAQNLALASQSLGIFISLIPYVREAIRRHLNHKQAVMLTEFDRIRRDFQEHQNEIHLKFVAIMNERLNVNMRSFHSMKWDDIRSSPSKYMETLVKEVTVLHNVLAKNLPLNVYDSILRMVFSSYDQRLIEEVEKLDFKNESMREKIMADIEYYESKLSIFPNVEGPTKKVSECVQAKELKSTVSTPNKSVEVVRQSDTPS